MRESKDPAKNRPGTAKKPTRASDAQRESGGASEKRVAGTGQVGTTGTVPRKQPQRKVTRNAGSTSQTAGNPRVKRTDSAHGGSGRPAKVRKDSAGSPRKSPERRAATSTTRAAAAGNRVQGSRLKRAEERRVRAVKARRRKIGLISAGLLVAVICVALVGKFVIGQLQDRSTATVVSPTSQYTPVACTSSDLDVAIAVTDSVVAGGAANFTVTLHNTSTQNPCYIDVGWGNMTVGVTSGSAALASTADCQSGSESSLRLLDRDMETTVSVQWNGGIGTGCVDAATNPSQAGTYQAALTFDDSDATATTTFHVN